MKYLGAGAVAAVALAAVSSVTLSQRSSPVRAAAPTMAPRPVAVGPVDARSQALVAAARKEASAGRVEAANDLLESALVIDPKNRDAFLALGDVARGQGLPGKAIRLYREALALNPNDRAALAGQGEALVAKGAVTRAQENLTKLQTLCRGNCPEQLALTDAIKRGPPQQVAAAEPAKP